MATPLTGPRTPPVPVRLEHPLLTWLIQACDDLAVLDADAPPAPWQAELLRGSWWVAPSRPRRVADTLCRMGAGTVRDNRAAARLIARARNLVPGLVVATRAVIREHSGVAEYLLTGGPACPGCGTVWPCQALRRAALPLAGWAAGWDPAWGPSGA